MPGLHAPSLCLRTVLFALQVTRVPLLAASARELELLCEALRSAQPTPAPPLPWVAAFTDKRDLVEADPRKVSAAGIHDLTLYIRRTCTLNTPKPELHKSPHDEHSHQLRCTSEHHNTRASLQPACSCVLNSLQSSPGGRAAARAQPAAAVPEAAKASVAGQAADFWAAGSW